MPETPVNPLSSADLPVPRRRRRWWKFLLALVVLAAVAYFGLTSGAFLKAVVLPRVGAALNAKVTASGISFSPFSRLQLEQVRVETTGEQPVLRAERVTVRYRLFSLIRGQIVVPEVTLVNPEVNVVRTADGRSNLDPLLAGETERAAPPRRSEAPTVDIGSVRIQSGVLGFCEVDQAGARRCTVVTNLDLTLTNLRNNAAGKLAFSALVLQTGAGTNGMPDTARGKLAGALDFELAGDLMPRQLQGNVGLEFTEAVGAFRELAGLSSTLDLDLTPQELRQLALRFQRQGQRLGEVRFRGPLDFARQAGRVDFTLTSVGRTALNMFGAPLGLDFGETAIEGTGFCDVGNGGQRLTVNIKLGARNFSVRQGTTGTPPLDLQFELRGNTDLTARTAYVDRFSVTGSQAGKSLLSLELLRALNLGWSPGGQAVTSPGVVQATLSDLRLADWRPLMGTNILDGTVNLRATISSLEAGQQITAEFTNTVHGLRLVAGETRLEDIRAMLAGTLNVSEFRVLALDRGTFSYGEGTNDIVQGTYSASHDPRNTSGNAQFTANADLPVFLARHPVPNLVFSRGSLRTTLLLNWDKEQWSANASLLAGDVSGTVGGFQVSGYSTQFDAVGELQRDKFFVRRLGLTAREGPRAGGSAEVVGEFDGANQSAQITLNLAGLNQSALRPFLAPWLTSHQLASVNVDASGELRYNAGEVAPATMDYVPRLERLLDQLSRGVGTTTLRLAANTTNLVLTSRATGRSNPATGFGLVLDANRQREVFDLGQSNRLQLTPTPRAANELLLAGRLDLSATNPTPSTLTARSTGLDLTQLYDLMSVLASTDGAAAKTVAARPAETPVESEPAPVSLPVRKLTASLQVDALYVHEMAISDWTAKAVVDGGTITVSPFKLAFNKAPVTAQARLDLSRPGYLYDFGLDAAGIPLEPIVNSTAPEYQGKIRGDVFSQLQIRGAGITGPSLQKNLNGTVRLSCTNLNFEIVTPRTKRLLTTLATAFRIQDLATSPLTLLAADIAITNGSVNVQPFTAASDAFFAIAQGAIRLAPVLTNSAVNLPVQFALRQDLARQIKLANLTASTRSNYLALPPLVRLAGTLGAPETEIDKVRLAALVAGSLGGALGGQTGTALEGVNSLLQGNTQGALGSLSNLLQRPGTAASTNVTPSGTAPRSGTNAPAPSPPQTSSSPATNATSTAIGGVNSLLQGDTQGALGNLNRLLQQPRPASTNRPPAATVPKPATNAPAAAPAAPAAPTGPRN